MASIIIPARNEEADIAGCLEAVAEQNVGAEQLEVIVADGRSRDGTRTVCERVGPSLGFASFRVLDNEPQGISTGLNLAAQTATSDYLVRVDARSRIEPHHVRTVVETLTARPEVGVIGGMQVPSARGKGVMEAGIARALANRYSTGLGRYRRSGVPGPADTVWMGAFRRSQVIDLGGWDEGLVVNEDFELCERYRASGCIVWFDPMLRARYLPRGDLRNLAGQYLRFGKVRGVRWRAGAPMEPRHMVLLMTPPALTLAGVAMWRRLGPTRLTIVGLGALLLADHLGVDEPAPVPVRSCAGLATVVSNASWWSGTVVGLATGRMPS